MRSKVEVGLKLSNYDTKLIHLCGVVLLDEILLACFLVFPL